MKNYVYTGNGVLAQIVAEDKQAEEMRKTLKPGEIAVVGSLIVVGGAK